MSERPRGAADYWQHGANSSARAGADAGRGLWLFQTSTLLFLTFFPANGLGGVLDALALIGFGRAIRSDLGRDLAYALAIGPAYGNHRRPLTGDPHIAGDHKRDIVAIAELKVQRVSLNRSTIAYARDLEIDREARRHSGDHIVYQSSSRSPHRTRLLGVAFWCDR